MEEAEIFAVCGKYVKLIKRKVMVKETVIWKM
jgi:hypothetical protein